MNNKRGEEDSLEHVAKRVQKKPHGKVTANEPATKAAQVEVTVVEPSSPSPLRGILPTPPEVEKLVAREVARLSCSGWWSMPTPSPSAFSSRSSWGRWGV